MRGALLAVTALSLLAVPAAPAADRTAAAVFFDGAFIKSGETVWQGNVVSTKACGKDRRVFIFRVRPGRDAKIGSALTRKPTRTKSFYPFSYSEPGVARSGEYYAKIRATQACRGNRSATLHGPA